MNCNAKGSLQPQTFSCISNNLTFCFLHPQTNSTASFFSRFSFSILSSPSCPFGEGLAFLIASSTHFPSLSMGLSQPSPSSTSFVTLPSTPPLATSTTTMFLILIFFRNGFRNSFHKF